MKTNIGSKTKQLWQDPVYRERMRQAHIGQRTTHGGTGTPLYNTWTNMRQRCGNPKNNSYKNYGGRGIKCEWKSYEEFVSDMGISHKEHKASNISTSIDRIDNDGNYSKDNCRWITAAEQQKNTRRVIAAWKPTKKCRVCQIVKPRSDFYTYTANVKGVEAQCRSCKNNRAKLLRLKRKENA